MITLSGHLVVMDMKLHKMLPFLLQHNLRPSKVQSAIHLSVVRGPVNLYLKHV